MTLLEMTLHGDPVSKARPRVNNNGHAFTPERTRSAERAITTLVQSELKGAAPYEGPVGVAFEFFCATKRRTDGDNLMKLVLDAINGVVFLDDSQVLEYYCRIHRGVGKANARTEVLVYELDELIEPAAMTEPA